MTLTEDAFHAAEQARGDLAYSPDTLPCYECGGFDGITAPERPVVKLGPITNKFDPIKTYILECGHLAF